MDFVGKAALICIAFVGVLWAAEAPIHERYGALRQAQWHASPSAYQTYEAEINAIADCAWQTSGWRAWIRILPWIVWQLLCIILFGICITYALLFILSPDTCSLNWFIIVCLALVGCTAIVGYGYYERHGPYGVIKQGASCYMHPNADSPCIAYCATCQEASILTRSDRWLQVKTKANVGWIQKEQVHTYTVDIWT